MSTFIIHLLIPVLVVLAMGIFRPRDAWMWSWWAVVGDIDYLGWIAHVKYDVPNVHRALFHNVFILFTLLFLSWRAFAKWRLAGGATLKAFAATKPMWLLAPFYYASHLILDLFQGGVVAFWPLSNRDYFWDFEIVFDTTKPIPRPEVMSEPGFVPYVPPVSAKYTWLEGEQFAFVLLYAISVGLLFAFEWANRRSLRKATGGEGAPPMPPF